MCHCDAMIIHILLKSKSKNLENGINIIDLARKDIFSSRCPDYSNSNPSGFTKKKALLLSKALAKTIYYLKYYRINFCVVPSLNFTIYIPFRREATLNLTEVEVATFSIIF